MVGQIRRQLDKLKARIDGSAHHQDRASKKTLLDLIFIVRCLAAEVEKMQIEMAGEE